MNKREVNGFLPKCKKGFELVWNTVIIIILGLILLTTVVLFFTGTAGSFFDTISSYFSETNVDSVIDGCNVMAGASQEYAFCCEKKTVKYYLEGEKVKEDFSCGELVNKDFVSGKIDELNCEGQVC